MSLLFLYIVHVAAAVSLFVIGGVAALAGYAAIRSKEYLLALFAIPLSALAFTCTFAVVDLTLRM